MRSRSALYLPYISPISPETLRAQLELQKCAHTPHPAPCTLHPARRTPHPTPHTPTPTPYTRPSSRCVYARDALTKAIYASLFDWAVRCGGDRGEI